ncbi:hypothetical protein [Staphylococcus equorum]|uniref:hypothetical protein n=1 Tax=Staphylococcus equorum TaxID=246432 RepID=UPI003FD7D565
MKEVECMEIVKEIVEYNQTGMYYAKVIPIILGVMLLVPIGMGIIDVIKQKKSKVKGEKFKKISMLILMYVVAMAVISTGLYLIFKDNAKYTSAKVEGYAILEKYEDEGNGTVIAKLKGKDNKVMNIYLDSSDVLNQKEKINRGDKVKVESDKAYPLIKQESVFLSEREYKLKEGSELEKVE